MPKWIRNRILYQIFPDLFFKDNSNEVPQKYYGGTLKGIILKLDYIRDFGFDAIYLNPVFKAETNHRYDVLDYFQTDPILGTNEDFETLVKECHKRDIKVILDIPFNHTSKNHPWFKEAKNNNSKYKNYFFYDEGEYNRWRGSDLVELNLDNPEVLEELITGSKSVLKFWMDKGIDGVRLDCANDIGMKVVKLIRDTAHKWNDNFLVMGEVFNFAGEWSKVLDSLQSYYLTGLLFSLVNGEISIQTFSNALDHVISDFDYEVLLNSLNILSSHDTTRVLDRINDMKIYKILLAIQFTFPGVPVVLYGEEVGIRSNKIGEASARNVMVFDENKWNSDVVKLYKTFIQLRKSRKELQEGKFKNLTSLTDYKLISFIRYGEKREEFSIVVINPNNKRVRKRIYIPYSHFHDALKVRDYFSGREFICEISSINVDLEPYQVMLLIPEWKYIKGYSFYKRQ